MRLIVIQWKVSVAHMRIQPTAANKLDYRFSLLPACCSSPKPGHHRAQTDTHFSFAKKSLLGFLCLLNRFLCRMLCFYGHAPHKLSSLISISAFAAHTTTTTRDAFHDFPISPPHSLSFRAEFKKVATRSYDFLIHYNNTAIILMDSIYPSAHTLINGAQWINTEGPVREKQC